MSSRDGILNDTKAKSRSEDPIEPIHTIEWKRSVYSSLLSSSAKSGCDHHVCVYVEVAVVRQVPRRCKRYQATDTSEEVCHRLARHDRGRPSQAKLRSGDVSRGSRHSPSTRARTGIFSLPKTRAERGWTPSRVCVSVANPFTTSPLVGALRMFAWC